MIKMIKSRLYLFIFLLLLDERDSASVGVTEWYISIENPSLEYIPIHFNHDYLERSNPCSSFPILVKKNTIYIYIVFFYANNHLFVGL